MKPNVYYLAPAAPEAAPVMSRLPRALALRLRLLAFWCRLRLTAVEIAGALRRFGRAEDDLGPIVLEQRADLVVAAAPRPARAPGRVIDLATASARRGLG
jgi:hypothetical protein